MGWNLDVGERRVAEGWMEVLGVRDQHFVVLGGGMFFNYASVIGR
jgi:hypothetical protein